MSAHKNTSAGIPFLKPLEYQYSYQAPKGFKSLTALQDKILRSMNDRDKGFLQDYDVYDFSQILDNSLGGVVQMPLSIQIYYDENGVIQPVFEPIFFDKEGKARPLTAEYMEEYLYGAKLIETKYNKMVKLYGSGLLNQQQIKWVRDFFQQLEQVGYFIDNGKLKIPE